MIWNPGVRARRQRNELSKRLEVIHDESPDVWPTWIASRRAASLLTAEDEQLTARVVGRCSWRVQTVVTVRTVESTHACGRRSYSNIRRRRPVQNARAAMKKIAGDGELNE
jgi:hypothetical protein